MNDNFFEHDIYFMNTHINTTDVIQLRLYKLINHFIIILYYMNGLDKHE